MHFAIGDGHLFALPENFDYQGPAEEPAAGTNLALDAQVYCETSQGSDGWYMANLNDGIRFSDGSTSNGWQSSAGVESSENSITLDLGTTRKFNRIDLYPTGELLTFADYMPKDFSIDVSEDASIWTTVKTVTDMDTNSCIVPSYSFDSVTARYVRISIAEMAGINGRYAASLSEIEVYNDDGTVPATESPLDSSVVEYTPGMNIALSKKVYVSSSTPDSIYKQWGWSADYVNDGLSGVGTATCGWTSNVKINTTETANEWVAIYFGDLFNVNQINVSPTLNGAFPYDYTIELSENGKN